MEEEPALGMDAMVAMLQGAQEAKGSVTSMGDQLQRFNMQKFLELWNKDGPYSVELSGPLLQAAASSREAAKQATKDYIRSIGSDPLNLQANEMRQFQRSETERFKRIADGAGIRPQ